MKDGLRWLQLVALLPLTVAAVPLLINQCSEVRTREALEKEAARQATLGKQAEEAGDLALATHAYNNAVTADPDEERYQELLMRSHIIQILADASVISGGNALALHAQLARAVTSTKDPDADLLMAFGRLLQYRGIQDQALARYKQAAEKAPESPLAHLLLGDALLKAGSLEAAAATLTTSVEKKDSALAQFALGQVRIAQGRDEDALTHLEKAAEKLFNAQVFLALGETYLKLKKPKKAEATLIKALALQPKLNGLQRPLADAYAENNKVELAENAYKQAFDQSGDLENLRRLGRIYRDTNRPKESAEVFNKIRIVKDDDAEAHCAIALWAELNKDLLTAKGAYGKCIEHSMGKKDLRELFENAEKRMKVIDQAIVAAKAAQAEEDEKKKPEAKKGRNK